MKINVKSQKGAITLVVLITMLFLMSFLISMYLRLANKAQISIETTKEISKKYNNIDNIDDLYNNYFSDENIIPITTVEQLKLIGSGELIEVNGKIYEFSSDGYYAIQNDLNLEGRSDNQWNPLFPYDSDELKRKRFTGVLDGLGYTITGLYIDNNNNYQGLFGILDGTVKNVNIAGGSITTTGNYVGAIAGMVIDDTGVIKNCYNTMPIYGGSYVGGMAGNFTNHIINCKNTGIIRGNSNVTGGYLAAIEDNSNNPVDIWNKYGTLLQNYKFISGQDVAIVPKGFKVSANTDEQTISDGMVIQDTNDNEFVWVPVENPTRDIIKNGILDSAIKNSDIQDLIGNNIYAMAVRRNYNNTLDSYIGVLYGFSGQQPLNLTSLYDGEINTTGYEEPDDLTISGEYSESFYKTEYDNMVESVEAYMGFYVGRYEISLDSTGTYAQSKKNQTALVSNNSYFTNEKPWYIMYQLETEYATKVGGLGVNSSMIWGSQWDQVMLFVNGKKDGTGNDFYITTTGHRQSGNDSIKTGMNDVDKVCNIYDLESGRQEWTLEANGFSRRTVRGGNYNSDGTASQRSSNSDNYAQPNNIPNNDYISSRMTLYIKVQ